MIKKSLQQMSVEELGELFPIFLVDHNTSWGEVYKKEESMLKKSLAGLFLGIFHIGSTSIPGIKAKPTIDILLEVSNDTNLENLAKKIVAAGYEYIQQPEKPAPHMMFVKGYTLKGFRGQAFHIHVKYQGSRDEIVFRDYLLGHPESAREYENLKIELSKQYKHDREAYTQMKKDFVQQILHRAAESGAI